MKRNHRKLIIGALLIGSLALTACGIRDKRPQSDDTINPAEQTVIDQTAPVTPDAVSTVAPVTTPAVVVTPAPAPTPGSSAAPILTPPPSATPLPLQTPVPTRAPAQSGGQSAGQSSSGQSASGLPVVTKSPTSETVAPGGSCWCVAKYKDAIYAEWHFVSPDGSRDLDYSQAAKEFPGLEIVDGYASTMQLKNIPSSLNGWKVYCRFSNKAGAVTTSKAGITVTGSQQGGQASGAPLVTKNPTGETVAPGGACSFVARYKDAIWAEWHFVSPDGSRDILYTQAWNEFPGLTIKGGDTSVLKLSTIPSGLNGWSVYCRFTNNNGGANTTRAGITVTGGGGGSAVIVPDTSGTVVPGDPANPYPSGSGGSGTVVPGDPSDPYPGGSGTVIPGGPGDQSGPTPGGSGTVIPGGPGDSGSPGVIIIG